MPLTRLTCPICLAVLKPSQPVAEGARVRCPKCKGAFMAEGEARSEEPAAEAIQETLPQAIEEPAAADLMEAVAADDDLPRKKSKARDDHQEEEERDDPPRKKKAKRGMPLWLWLTLGGVGLLLLCGCCGVPGIMLSTGNLSLPGSGSSTASNSGFFGASFGTTVTMDNYKKIQRNMLEGQVIAILGQPTQSQKFFGLKMDVWQNGNDLISVTFDNTGRATNRECRITINQITTVTSGF